MSEPEEAVKPYIKFSISEDATVEIHMAPGDTTAKHWGALLYLIQSGAIATQVVKCMDSYANNAGMDEWVNSALIEWFALVMKAEKESAATEKKGSRNPMIRARDVLPGMGGMAGGQQE
jgi:hypothetical protein